MGGTSAEALALVAPRSPRESKRRCYQWTILGCISSLLLVIYWIRQITCTGGLPEHAASLIILRLSSWQIPGVIIYHFFFEACKCCSSSYRMHKIHHIVSRLQFEHFAPVYIVGFTTLPGRTGSAPLNTVWKRSASELLFFLRFEAATNCMQSLFKC